MKKNPYLKEKFDLKISAENKLSFKINGNSYCTNYPEINTLPREECYTEKIRAKLMLLGIAHKNNNFELIKKVYNFFNDNIDNYFVNSEKDEYLHSSILNTFCNFINYLKPKYQSHLIKNLEINSIKDFKNLTLISCTLF